MHNQPTFDTIIRDWVAQNFESLTCDFKAGNDTLHVQYRNWTVFWVSGGIVWYRINVRDACCDILDPVEPTFFEKLKNIVEQFIINKNHHDNSVMVDNTSELMVRFNENWGNRGT